jgi:predicted RNA binding protein YcfA (HicA-like mRNA interferase family)
MTIRCEDGIGLRSSVRWRRANLPVLSKHEKTLDQVLSGRSDANVRFDDLRALLLALGFVERTRGSHHMFGKAGVDEQINVQRDGAKAKPYQVKQVRTVFLRYNL